MYIHFTGVHVFGLRQFRKNLTRKSDTKTTTTKYYFLELFQKRILGHFTLQTGPPIHKKNSNKAWLKGYFGIKKNLSQLVNKTKF